MTGEPEKKHVGRHNDKGGQFGLMPFLFVFLLAVNHCSQPAKHFTHITSLAISSRPVSLRSGLTQNQLYCLCPRIFSS
jgi:hypothetical protein